MKRRFDLVPKFMPNKQQAIKNRSVEYSQFKTLRLISFLLYGVFGMVLIVSMWFLYTRMYQTIGQVESISALSPAIGVQVLELDDFDNVRNILEARNTQRVPRLVRDPFNTPEAFAAYIVSTTPEIVPVLISTSSTVTDILE